MLGERSLGEASMQAMTKLKILGGKALFNVGEEESDGVSGSDAHGAGGGFCKSKMCHRLA